MLGLQLKLTPAQVKMLLMLTYMEWHDMKWADGTVTKSPPMEVHTTTHYLLTKSALERRGLIAYDCRQMHVTEEGKAVASLVYQSARAITSLVEQSIHKEAEL